MLLPFQVNFLIENFLKVCQDFFFSKNIYIGD